MIYVKINSTLYPASISGRISDNEWDGRESKSITMEADFATVNALFPDGAAWSIVSEESVPAVDEDGAAVLDGEGNPTYTTSQTVDTYNEYGMVAHAGSYIDDFYQTYWTDYLDDCLACGDTYNFFLRHYDDFVTAYASTDPSEDICEAFAYFVLRPRDPMADTAVWSQKLDFFYAYPELTAFRDQVRSGLGLAEDQAYEDLFPAADSSTDPAAEAA